MGWRDGNVQGCWPRCGSSAGDASKTACLENFPTAVLELSPFFQLKVLGFRCVEFSFLNF